MLSREPGPPRLSQATSLALLSAGVFLTHLRLFLFFGVFVLAALALRWPRGWAGWRALALAVILGGGLALPWIVRLATQALPRVVASPGRLAAATGYNAFPVEYFRSVLDRGWLLAALLALAWGVFRRERAVAAVGLWVAATFGLLNLGPGTWLVNNNSWAITLFVPGSILVGWGADRLLGLATQPAPNDPGNSARVRRWRWLAAFAAQTALAGLAAYAGVRGWKAQVEVVRPVTVLANASDAEALAWVRDHTPAEAVFVVNGWRWLPNIWAGSDGGAWLWPWADRRTTLPPVDYNTDSELQQRVNAFNEAAETAFATSPDSPEALALLRQAGVTHVFIGAKGGTLKPEAFAASPDYRLIYTNGADWVFELK
jgi:hypothetical protein